jgi:hypothetical protein
VIGCNTTGHLGIAATNRRIVMDDPSANRWTVAQTVSETVRRAAIYDRLGTVGTTMGATMEQASDGRLLDKPALIGSAVSYSPEG